MWRRRKRDHEPTTPDVRGGTPMWTTPRTTPYTGELLFALPGEEVGTIDLDCVVFDPAIGADLPLHVSARLPQDSIAGKLGASALESWSLDGEPISVELWLSGTRPRIALSRDGTRLMLRLPVA